MHLTSTTKVGHGWVLAGREKDRRSQGGCCNDLMLSHSQEKACSCNNSYLLCLIKQFIHNRPEEKAQHHQWPFTPCHLRSLGTDHAPLFLKSQPHATAQITGSLIFQIHYPRLKEYPHGLFSLVSLILGLWGHSASVQLLRITSGSFLWGTGALSDTRHGRGATCPLATWAGATTTTFLARRSCPGQSIHSQQGQASAENLRLPGTAPSKAVSNLETHPCSSGQGINHHLIPTTALQGPSKSRAEGDCEGGTVPDPSSPHTQPVTPNLCRSSLE